VNYLIVIKIDQYEVMYSANKFFPRISLINTGKQVGQLHFQPNGAVLSPDAISSGIYMLFYHLDDYPNCIDLLRNESPVYLVWMGGGANVENAIRTNSEVVGENDKI